MKKKRDLMFYMDSNTMYSVPLPGVNVPPWFAEGTAQIMTPDLSLIIGILIEICC